MMAMPTPTRSFLRKGCEMGINGQQGLLARDWPAHFSHDDRGKEDIRYQGDHAELHLHELARAKPVRSRERTGATTEGGAKPYARKLPSSPAAIRKNPSSHSLLFRKPLSVLGPDVRLLLGEKLRCRLAMDSTGETRTSGVRGFPPKPP